jgi:hypothetical protein
MRLALGFRGGLEHLIEDTPELLEAGGGDDDVVVPAADILRDAQKSAAGIFPEGKNECFALDLDLAGFDRVFLASWPWLSLQPATGRMTIV